ncbi:MAG: ABC transporter permease [Hamadaea sp.]|uniref:ABC transporter permease n=1 Tax=Hamadaea sp. TaxID=2024425 RepID=UPI001836F838|nr:ABC transporter permease [Hamadaea sp.]NUR71422.1 ABC transporter permease [Hamadaea sp.]NUT23732.1 ABC transporter permease [Hamadaea sp.]
MSASAVLIRHNFALLFAEPGPALSRVGMPLVLITALRPLYSAALGSAGLTQAVTGMLVLFSLLGLNIIAGGILTERSWHTLDRLRATPARPAQILVGKAVPLGAMLIAQQGAIIAYSMIFLGLRVPRPDLLLVAGVSWAVTLLAAGAALATVVRSQSELSAVNDLGGMFFTVLGGAMVPLALMPAWMRAAAPASPGYWALHALTAALTGDGAATVRAAAVLLAVATVLGAFASWRMTRGWGRNRLL